MKNKRKQSLQSIIKNEYLRSIIFPLLVIEATLLVAYFWSNNYVATTTQSALIDETKINIQEISSRSASLVSSEFKSVEDMTKLFQARHNDFYKTFQPEKSVYDPSYHVTKDGVIVNDKVSDETCTLFYSNVSKDQPYRLNKAVATGELDSMYNEVISTNSNIVQVYFNSNESMNRLCPYMPDALGQYPHDIDIPTYNFYYLADKQHNPKKGVVWTDAYLDPAGQGWMISAIAPVYKKSTLEGVVGIDVTLEKIIKNILSIKLPYTSYALLVDKEGNILAMDQQLEPIFGMKELTKHDYDKPIVQTITKPKDFNVKTAKNSPIASKIKQMLEAKSSIDSYSDVNNDFLITQNTIDQTGWKLILLVDQNSILGKSVALKNQTDKIGYAILSLMALFYVIFFIVIIRRSRQFSQEILTPVEVLVNSTNELKSNLQLLKMEHSDIEEIDTLIDNFTVMGSELIDLYASMQDKIDEGIGKNLESQKMLVYQSRLAAMGEMINMIAHQWRQPLNVISMMNSGIYLDYQLGSVDEETVKSTLSNMGEEIQKLSKMIDEFRSFFKPENELSDVKLQEVFENVEALMGATLEQNGIKLNMPQGCDIVLKSYPRELAQVFMSLVKNSQDAFLRQGKSEGSVMIKVEKGEDKIILLVEDNGGGIPSEIVSNIFEPYFSTKLEKNGMGLGLFMAKIIVEQHLQGAIEVANSDKGATFKIELPYL